MTRKYHSHKLQTTPWHREEELLNCHKTPGRQQVPWRQHQRRPELEEACRLHCCKGL